VKRPGESEFHAPMNPPHVWPAGTEVLYMTAGGGGWGDPLDREPHRVLRDVREGYVAAAQAREQYGVVLTAHGQGVDEAATQAERARLRAERSKARAP
jgi:N-methylhydantoinase B